MTWTRPTRPTRPARPARSPEQPRNSVSLLFYSYPPRVIADWCGVTLQHAYRLKRAESAPSRGALKLFELQARGRVLGPEWRGWRVMGDRLIDPDGGELTAARLHGYQLIIQFAAGLAREAGTAAQDQFYEMLQKVG